MHNPRRWPRATLLGCTEVPITALHRFEAGYPVPRRWRTYRDANPDSATFHPIGGPLLSLTAFTLVPATAHAQYSAPEMSGGGAIGEKYHAEVRGRCGILTSTARFRASSSACWERKIDLVDDLGYAKTRFKDFRLVLRPSKKANFRMQYTPIDTRPTPSCSRNLVFNGISFPLAIPVSSQFNWNVWRLGYEYDLLYKSRGFVGSRSMAATWSSTRPWPRPC